MKPLYDVKVWQEDGWWLARVLAVSDGGDTAPLNALTQARTLARIEDMARDLIATILDVDEGSFGVNVDYVLPPEVNELVCEANGARVFLDAAQELWQEQSAAAVRALAEQGYSLRETAKLLGLSHQRVDQLLQRDVRRGRRSAWALQVVPTVSPELKDSRWCEIAKAADNVWLVFPCSLTGDGDPRSAEWKDARRRIGSILEDFAQRT